MSDYMRNLANSIAANILYNQTEAEVFDLDGLYSREQREVLISRIRSIADGLVREAWEKDSEDE